MQHKPLFLVAAIAEIFHVFILGLLARAAGLVGAEGLLPALFRYVAAPELLFGAAFFFLWLEGRRYAVYRPLALLGKVLSLAVFLPFGFSLRAMLGGETLVPWPGTALVASFALLLLDLGELLVLLLYGRFRDENRGEERKEDRSLNKGEEPEGAPVPGLGPRGPEDIERVEV